MMSESDQQGRHHLIKAGALVEFRILDTRTSLGLDNETIEVAVDLIMTPDDEDVDPGDVVEWGAFGFLLVLP
jgi:hypothetical protein